MTKKIITNEDDIFMNSYNFSVLNDKDFEELCRELLSVELGVSFQSFKNGQDGGIDLRYSTANDNEIIVQAKHYLKSGFSKLKSDLKIKEFPKVEKLSPKRYIITTSLELSPKQAEELKDVFGKYVHSLQDVYYKQRLDSILAKNHEIERRFYKLWLTSSNVLKSVLHSGVYGMSEILLREISNDIGKYVESTSHSSAYERLLAEKVIIITGRPGVGKTTLAKIVAYKLVVEKNCELIEINDSLKDATNLVDFSGEKNQVIFFDDFLGANLFEVINPQNSEGHIQKFIRRIQSAKGKYLIITSRTVILNQAIARYESFKRKGFNDADRFVIQISDYTRKEKALILYNHLYFDCSNKKILDFVRDDEFYLEIIDHPNFNPRIIEFITSDQYTNNSNAEDYKLKVLDSLNNPEFIWRSSYENQIENYERWVLQTLLTFGRKAEYKEIEKSFNDRLTFEIKNGATATSESSFINAMIKLSGSYINLTRGGQEGQNHIATFSNPSIGDFLLDHISNDFTILRRILLSSTSIKQYDNIYEYFSKSYRLKYKQFKVEFFDYFKSIELKLIGNKDMSSENIIKVCNLYFLYFPDLNIENIIDRLLTEDILFTETGSDFSDYIKVIKNVKDCEIANRLIKPNWDEIIENLYGLANEQYEYEVIPYLFEEYEVDFREWVENDNINSSIKWEIEGYFNKAIQEHLFDNFLEYEFIEEEKIAFYDGEYYISGYEYELEDDLKSKAESFLDDKLVEMQLDYLIDIGDLDIDYGYLENEIEQSYKDSMENEAKENYKMRRHSSQSHSSDSGNDIHNLFE